VGFPTSLCSAWTSASPIARSFYLIPPTYIHLGCLRQDRKVKPVQNSAEVQEEIIQPFQRNPAASQIFTVHFIDDILLFSTIGLQIKHYRMVGMTTKKLLLIAVIIVFFTGCATKGTIDKSEENTISDTPVSTATAETTLEASTNTDNLEQPTASKETVTAEDCAAMGITEEECINFGTHEYASTTSITYNPDGNCLPREDKIDSITFIFYPQGRLTQSRNGSEPLYVGHTGEFSTYVDFYESGPLTWVTEMTFTTEGFSEESKAIGTEDQTPYCIYESEYTRLN
jgi:hypothetical protein